MTPKAQNFINETSRCPICKCMYYNRDLVECDKCNRSFCLKCIIFAGKLGKFCNNCIKQFSDNKKSKILKNAKKLKFWAENGYKIFLLLLVCTIFSFSLFFLDPFFLFLGLIFALISVIFVILILNLLSQY